MVLFSVGPRQLLNDDFLFCHFQVKCPECRAEHRFPYNGIQGFPTNYTLQKFLELHSEITGELPDPNADAIMSRCNVCSEKAYIHPCAHCDKKVGRFSNSN